MKTIGLNRSLLISVLFHVSLVLLLSLTLPKNPFMEQIQPIVVNINAPTETIASGLENVLDKPTSQNAPSLRERITKSAERSLVRDKVKIPPKIIKSEEDSANLKEEIKRSVVSDTKKIKKIIKQDDTVEEVVSQQKYVSADEVLDDMFEEEERSQVQKQQQVEDISDKIDNILDNADSASSTIGSTGAKVGSSDPLNDAKWSSAPRKTLFFPDIRSKIPAKYRKKGMGYSVKVKIAFDMNGLAVRVDLIESSGDPVIDNLFLTELRKIRVESSTKPGLDEISKTFTISVK